MFDGKVGRIDHCFAVDVEAPGLVEHAAHDDGIRGHGRESNRKAQCEAAHGPYRSLDAHASSSSLVSGYSGRREKTIPPATGRAPVCGSRSPPETLPQP